MSEHAPTAGPVPSASPTRSGMASYRGACSCGWTAPTVRQAAGRSNTADAKAAAQRDALEHAREAGR